MGEVRLEFLHTPGHTLEHISLLITDRSRGEEPAILFSGGALLVGDLARPDLLGGEEATRRSASLFCRTLQSRILSLPDFVEVYPTHVSGSLCGGSSGSRLSTTICVQVEPGDVEAIRAHLTSHGAEVGDLVNRYGALGNGPSLYIDDPEGNRVELKGPPLP